MKTKNKPIHVREIEKKLFSYLFLNKVATANQIQRDLYLNKSHQALYKRLNLLIKNDYLKANYNQELRGRLVYSLSKKAFHEFITGNDRSELREQFSSNSILHDLDLVNIRTKMKTFSQVKAYYTENLIQSGVETLDSELIKDLKSYHFDAILKINRNNNEFLIPLEYERSLKYSSRYKEYFKKIYTRAEIKAILYIGYDQKVLTKIKSFEKSCIQNQWPKVFYSTLDGVLNNSLVTFTNLKNEKITFENRLQ